MPIIHNACVQALRSCAQLISRKQVKVVNNVHDNVNMQNDADERHMTLRALATLRACVRGKVISFVCLSVVVITKIARSGQLGV